MAVSTFQTKQADSTVTIMDTQLNALTSTGRAVSSAITNTLKYPEADAELVCSYASAPTANTCILCWILKTVDGTNYEDGQDGTLTPSRNPDFWFVLRPVTGSQRQTWEGIRMPTCGTYKVLAVADTTGQTMAATGNTIKFRESTGTGNT